MEEAKLNDNVKKYVASKQTAISKKYKVGDDVLANGNTGVITEVTEDVTVVLYKVRLMTDAETWFPENDIVKVELATYSATKKKQTAVDLNNSEVQFFINAVYDSLSNKNINPSNVDDMIEKEIGSDVFFYDFSDSEQEEIVNEIKRKLL